jgi:outer membrane protein insertion porin family
MSASASRILGIVAAAVSVVAILAAAASAQNPFLQNRGKRTIASITFYGQKVTKEYVLRREFGLEVGQTYDPVEVSDAWERLERLPFIAYVDVQEKRPEPGEVHIAVYVEEDDRFVILPSVDYMRRHDGYVLGLDLKMQNFRGRGETLEFTGTWLNLHGYRLAWANPSILGKARLGLYASGSWQRYDFIFRPLRLRDSWATLGLVRDLTAWLRVRSGMVWRELESDEADPGQPEGIVHDPAATLTLTVDTRDIRFYPTKGVFAQVEGRLAGLGQEAYQMLDAQVSAFVNVPFVDILGGTVRTRQVSQTIPFYERTYLGGPNDIRGLDFGSLEGEEFMVASLEIRRPLFLLPLREGRAVGLGLHAFHDWGKTFDHGSAFDAAPLRWSRGLGIHINFNTKNLRFEWAHTDEGDNAFVFEDEFTF